MCKDEDATWSDENADAGAHGQCNVDNLDCSTKAATANACIAPTEDGSGNACCKIMNL